MELCKRYPGAQGSFKLIDTPGPDEDGQGGLLGDKVQQVLQSADAVICVINGQYLKNKAQADVRDMIRSKVASVRAPHGTVYAPQPNLMPPMVCLSRNGRIQLAGEHHGSDQPHG
jgi:hypothetical protein